MPRIKSAAKQAKQKLTHAELSAIHKAKWAKIRENIAAKKASQPTATPTFDPHSEQGKIQIDAAIEGVSIPSELEEFVNDSIDAMSPVQFENYQRASASLHNYETKTYEDGTIATGVASLPEKSPAEQEPNPPTPPSQPNVPQNPQPEQPPAVPESVHATQKVVKKQKKYTGPKEFSVALKAAESRLAKAIVERAQAAGQLSMLQAEIPSLVQIINALKGQQNIPAAPYDFSGSVPNATAFQAPMPTGLPTGIMTRDQIEADNLAKIQAAMNAAQSFPVSKAIGSVQLAPEVIGSFDDNDDEDKFITGDAAGGSGWIGG